MAATVLFSLGNVLAQDGPPPGNDFGERDAPGPNRAGILRRELRLTPEQMIQIRQINAETRPKMRTAQQRYRVARRDLDLAIYADELDEPALSEKVRAVVEAQAEVTKVRAMSEVAVRRVLTPEQLTRFRRLRQRFGAEQESGQRAPQRRREGLRQKAPPRDAVRNEPPMRP